MFFLSRLSSPPSCRPPPSSPAARHRPNHRRPRLHHRSRRPCPCRLNRSPRRPCPRRPCPRRPCPRRPCLRRPSPASRGRPAAKALASTLLTRHPSRLAALPRTSRPPPRESRQRPLRTVHLFSRVHARAILAPSSRPARRPVRPHGAQAVRETGLSAPHPSPAPPAGPSPPWQRGSRHFFASRESPP